MKHFSKEAFQRAKTFIKSTARPLDEALFAFHMDGASSERVFSELSVYQNNDGGFGHGLEPDLQVPDSSVLATTIALQILRELNAGSDHNLMQGAMEFLMDRYDQDAKAWPFIPANSDSAPHAPWWQYTADNSQFLANPRPEIVGYLLDYPDLVPENFADPLLADVISHLESQEEHVEMHEMLCYARLLNSQKLPADIYHKLFDLLKPIVQKTVARDAESWDQYGLKPLAVAPQPKSPFATLLSKAIENNLDYEIERQMADGSWVPPWSWGDSFSEAWPHAKRAWQGILTVNTLRSLKDYGRIT